MEKKITRSSNIELLRIIMMIVIIAHHFVVNSGITKLYDFNNITGNMIFLQIFGFAGKAMINGFLLISGYFMIKGRTSFKKILRLYLQIKFYVFIIYFIMIFLGYETFSLVSFSGTLFSMIKGVNVGFSATFFLLYLLMPFINKLVLNLSKKQYTALLFILFFFYTAIPTYFIINDTFDEIGWYITMYLAGGYIRLYLDEIRLTSVKAFSLVAVNLILTAGSILVLDKLSYNPYHMVINANKLLAVTLAISLFTAFKNLDIGYSRWINKLSSATFGVLLIHANSDAMRQFLWGGVLKVTDFYNSDKLIIYAVLSVLAVYIICTLIELFRIRFIEKPVLNKIYASKLFNKLNKAYIDLWQ